MKKAIVNMAGIILIMFMLVVCVTVWLIQSERDNDKLQAQIEQLQKPVERLTITDAYTLIRTVEDYTYLKDFEVDKYKWEHADKQTDINGVTWREIISDGYIKVYCEGHILPSDIHWYSPY